jgi:hypothetical protein
MAKEPPRKMPLQDTTTAKMAYELADNGIIIIIAGRAVPTSSTPIRPANLSRIQHKK